MNTLLFRMQMIAQHNKSNVGHSTQLREQRTLHGAAAQHPVEDSQLPPANPCGSKADCVIDIRAISLKLMSWLLQPKAAAPPPNIAREDFSLRAEPATDVLEPSAHLTQVDGAHEPDLYIQDAESIWISQQRDHRATQEAESSASNLSGVLASQPRLATRPQTNTRSVFDDTLPSQQPTSSGFPASNASARATLRHEPVFAGFGASGGDAVVPLPFSAAGSAPAAPAGNTARSTASSSVTSSAPRAQNEPQSAVRAQPQRRKRLAESASASTEQPKHARHTSQSTLPRGGSALPSASFPVAPLAMYSDFAAAPWPQQLQGQGTALDSSGNLLPRGEVLDTPFVVSLASCVGEAALPGSLMRAARCTHEDLLQQVQAAHNTAIALVGTPCAPEGVLGFAIKLQGVDVRNPLVFLSCAAWLKAVPSSFALACQKAQQPDQQASSESSAVPFATGVSDTDVFDDLLGTSGIDMDELLQQPCSHTQAQSCPSPPAETATHSHQWTAWHEAWALLLSLLSMPDKRGTCAVSGMKKLLYPALQAMENFGWPSPRHSSSGGIEWILSPTTARGSILPACFPGHWVLDVSVAAWLLNTEASVDDNSFSLAQCLETHCPGKLSSQRILDANRPIQGELETLLALGPVMRAKLRRLGMGGTYDEVAGQLTPVLAQMELNGVCFDPEVCKHAETTIQRRLDVLERQAHDAAGQVFMVTSSKECARVLYEDLGLVATEGRRWNPAQPKKMHKSTAEGMLLQLAQQHPLPVYILAHRKLSKVLNGFVTPLLKLAIPIDLARAERGMASLQALWRCVPDTEGVVLNAPPRTDLHRIFTQLNQTSTGTGRLSSSNPNLQNLPKRSLVPVGGASGATPVLGAAGSASIQSTTAADAGGEGYMHLLEPLVDGACVAIRSAFAASSENTVLVAMDYSQVEMRILAHCCGDAALIEVFNAAARSSSGSASDVYKRLASNVFKVPVEEVTPPQRSQAKTVALGLVYGLGSQELSRKLGVSSQQANEIQSVFMKTYPGIRRFMAAARNFAAKHGFVLTLSGRRRHLPDISSSHAGKRTYAERQAVNSIIQGSAADLIACAMIRLTASTAAAREKFQLEKGVALRKTRPHVAADDKTSAALSQSRLLLQIHDELLVECPKDKNLCEAFVQHLRHVMEKEAPHLLGKIAADCRKQLHADPSVRLSAASVSSILGTSAKLQVPLATTAQLGNNWGSMVSIDPNEA